MSGVVSFGPSSVTTKRDKSVEKAAKRTANRENRIKRRSGPESLTDPRPATVPAPHPSLGVTRRSRRVSGQARLRRGGKEGCRGGFCVAGGLIGDCRGGERSSVMGEPPRGGFPPDNQRPACSPFAKPTKSRRRIDAAPTKPTMRDQLRAARRVSGLEGMMAPFGRAGAWRSPYFRDLRVAHLQRNLGRKRSRQTVVTGARLRHLT